MQVNLNKYGGGDDDSDDDDDDDDNGDDDDEDLEVSDLGPALQSACLCKLGPDFGLRGQPRSFYK